MTEPSTSPQGLRIATPVGIFILNFSYREPGASADRRATRAEIFDADGRLLTSGFATCSVKDPFSHYTGRKKALGRALRHVLGKEARRAFWAALIDARDAKGYPVFKLTSGRAAAQKVKP